MLVEDEAFVRGVTVAVLESAGYSVVAAKNATEAQQMYEQHSGGMDLLLADIVLPGEDGRHLAERLSTINSSMQVLLVTGYAEEMEREKSDQQNQSLLQKPFAAATLLQTVRMLLDRKSQQPILQQSLSQQP